MGREELADEGARELLVVHDHDAERAGGHGAEDSAAPPAREPQTIFPKTDLRTLSFIASTSGRAAAAAPSPSAWFATKRAKSALENVARPRAVRPAAAHHDARHDVDLRLLDRLGEALHHLLRDLERGPP